MVLRCLATKIPATIASTLFPALVHPGILHLSPVIRHSLCYADAVLFQPMPLSRRPLPFEWIFELKYDGFRALAILEHGRGQLISRNGHPFNSFADLRQAISVVIARHRKNSSRRGNCVPGQLRETAVS